MAKNTTLLDKYQKKLNFFKKSVDKSKKIIYNVWQDVEEKSRKLFNQYRDISFGERNERESFEHGLGVITSRFVYRFRL